MTNPAYLLPGIIATTKSAFGTIALFAEKSASNEPLSPQGAAGFFIFSFGFEFAFATLGVNNSATVAAAEAREKLLGVIAKTNLLKANEAGYKAAKLAFDDLKYLDLLSELGGFGNYANGAIFKLSPTTIKDIVGLTTESIGVNIPGLTPIYDGILELGEELFN